MFQSFAIRGFQLVIPPRETIPAKFAEATKLRGAASQSQLKYQHFLANRKKKTDWEKKKVFL